MINLYVDFDQFTFLLFGKCPDTPIYFLGYLYTVSIRNLYFGTQIMWY